jgi:hypothetical protein
VLRELRTMHPTLPVAIVSGHALEPVPSANATMVKPVPLQDLFTFVAQAKPFADAAAPSEPPQPPES